MKIRGVLRLGLFVAAAWLGGTAVASAQSAPATPAPVLPSPITGDIGFDFIPGPSSDIGFGKIVTGTSAAYGVHGNVQFNAGPIVPHAAFDYRNWQSTVMGTASTFQTTSFDGRVGVGIPSFIKRTFIGVGYLSQGSPYGTEGGAGFGFDVIPQYDRWFSVYGSTWYYPWESGTFSAGFPPGTAAPGPTLTQRIIKYRFGVTVGIPALAVPVSIDLGVAGDFSKQGNNYSPNTSEAGFFVGLRAALK